MGLMRVNARLQKLETQIGKRPALSCPPVAVGVEIGAGVYEVHGHPYTEREIGGCFTVPFIVLDDPEDTDERSG